MATRETGYKLSWEEFFGLGAVFIIGVIGIGAIAFSKQTGLEQWYVAHPEVVHKCCCSKN